LGEVPMGVHTQETGAGILEVDIQKTGLTFMEQTKATFFEEIPRSEVATILSISEEDFNPALPPQIVSTGIRDLLVPVQSKAVLARLRLNLPAITAFSEQHDISGFHMFTLLEGEGSLASARNSAPRDGIPEENATGTSNGALLCYLRRRGMLPTQPVYRIEQGEAMGQLSYVYGMFKGDIVWAGGEATIHQR
jgi:PhzF family phenazine biosynthesis protein